MKHVCSKSTQSVGCGAESINSIVRALLPRGGLVVTTIAHVYADTSHPTELSPFICTGGYVFEKSKAEEFNQRWKAETDAAGIRYFHMKDAGGPSGELVKLASGELDALYRKLIGFTRDLSLFGFSIATEKDVYDEFLSCEPMPTAFGFVCFNALILGRRWIEREAEPGARIAYFFEAGDADQRDANQFLDNTIFTVPEKWEEWGYAGHSFVPKQDAPALQAADMLAWHTVKAGRDLAAGRPVRKDAIALFRDQDRMQVWDRKDITRARNELIAAGHIDPT